MLFHFAPDATDFWTNRLEVFSARGERSTCLTFLAKTLECEQYNLHLTHARAVRSLLRGPTRSRRPTNRVQITEPFVNLVPTGASLAHHLTHFVRSAEDHPGLGLVQRTLRVR